MKTIEDIINQSPVFLNDWRHRNDVIADFEGLYMTNEEYVADESPYGNKEYWESKKRELSDAIEEYSNINILFASYGNENWSGDAWVLFEKDGKLFEVNGGHCSCYGLEEQWSPEEVLLEELGNRLINGTFGEDDWSGNEFKEELYGFIGIKERETII